MVDILTGTAFDAPKRMHHREDDVAAWFPSSVSSRLRNLLALKAQNWKANGGGEDPEEAMYKELIQGMFNNTVEEIDVDFPIDATYGFASGVRIVYGQTRLKKIRLRNLKTNNFSSNYIGDCRSLEEIWLDNSTWITNSLFVTTNNLRYVYAPKAGTEGGKIQNALSAQPAVGAVFDFGGSRTCQELIDSWATVFTGQPNTGWTFRCSDGDVVWDGSAWAKA